MMSQVMRMIWGHYTKLLFFWGHWLVANDDGDEDDDDDGPISHGNFCLAINVQETNSEN